MRYLASALAAEGPSDQRFLKPILRRLIEDLCLQYANDLVSIAEIQEVKGRGLDIIANLKDGLKYFHLLFIHVDGRSNPEGVRAQQVEPIILELKKQIGSDQSRPTVVAVVPVRETEAWALVDGEALRKALGISIDDRGLGIPSRPREVEHIPDPKASLRTVFQNAIGQRRGSRRNVAAELGKIGESIELGRLKKVPAFSRLEEDLYRALSQLGYIHCDRRP